MRQCKSNVLASSRSVLNILHRPDITLDTEHYDRTRRTLTPDEFSDLLKTSCAERRMNSWRDPDKVRAAEEVRKMLEAANKMSTTRKVHRGCVHSAKPEMIICKDDGLEDARGSSESNANMVGQDTVESSLAKSLYFKRCDGSFKNIKGERLETGLNGQQP